ncbi:hypothetical protein EBAPG3_010560 [Nitrosospira lacus]|uniref:Uncharacterized protein n=1 Tax=Nitrosospira lacus TaxID=1288494 RepID=A0A1W6SQT9_9PROT|nr:hypothetical protein [Nitrosospira lacus]ARO88184.1 hypothetical protein EBAPG3_010560 [Nitrosospira lacus]
MSESDITKLVLQNRRLTELLKMLRVQLIRAQYGRLSDAVLSETMRGQIEEELARSVIQAPPEK